LRGDDDSNGRERGLVRGENRRPKIYCASRADCPKVRPSSHPDDLPPATTPQPPGTGEDRGKHQAFVACPVERSEAEGVNEAQCTGVHRISASTFNIQCPTIIALGPPMTTLNTSHRSCASLTYTAGVGAVLRLSPPFALISISTRIQRG